MSAIVLPRVSVVRLTGFAPLFDKTVEIKIPKEAGSFLILGGNGLGKTTILQSIIFAIAGIADRDQQDAREDSRFKWDISYFKERVKDPKNAEVIVEFFLGTTRIQVRRGLDSDRVRGVRVDDDPPQNSGNAPKAFEEAVLRASHCSSFRDFRYLVHRLCYLPESRRNLVWDPDAQLALFLFICGEAGVEGRIREKTNCLRKDYVEMRHTHTSITNIRKRIDEAETRVVRIDTTAVIPEARTTVPQDTAAQRFDKLKLRLEVNAESISAVTSHIIAQSRILQGLADEIERDEMALAEMEEQFVLHSLRDLERGEQALALQKLLVLRQCPYCTQETEALATQASAFVSSGNCPICGLDHVSTQRPENLGSTKDALVLKVEHRSRLQAELAEAHNRRTALQDESAQLGAQLGQMTIQLPRVRRDERVGLSDDPTDLRKMLDAYETEHRQLDKSTSALKAEIEREYAAVEQAQARRYQMIEDLVAKYASEFLGATCEFARIPGKNVDKNVPFAFHVLVPSFGESARTEPHTCSESQAFFLDIAFRMALLDTVRELSNEAVTFICETPENALDMAYADNVAEMFSKFSRAGCFGLLTANLQSGGVAQPLLAKIKPRSERESRVFNLLEYSRLSVVQMKAKPKFDAQLEKLLGK